MTHENLKPLRSLVTAAYVKYASFLGTCDALNLSFLRSRLVMSPVIIENRLALKTNHGQAFALPVAPIKGKTVCNGWHWLRPQALPVRNQAQ